MKVGRVHSASVKQYGAAVRAARGYASAPTTPRGATRA